MVLLHTPILLTTEANTLTFWIYPILTTVSFDGYDEPGKPNKLILQVKESAFSTLDTLPRLINLPILCRFNI